MNRTIDLQRLILAAVLLTHTAASRALATGTAEHDNREPSISEIERKKAISELRTEHLTLPIAKMNPELMKGSFYEEHFGAKHEASDIAAARNTPVMAIGLGKLVKLFTSKAGGLTIYQFDAKNKYVFYYAHLERYADGLKEGEELHPGQVIGYVGTSGNAPPNSPHLHLSIGVMGAEKHWWQAAPVDPYEVLR